MLPIGVRATGKKASRPVPNIATHWSQTSCGVVVCSIVNTTFLRCWWMTVPVGSMMKPVLKKRSGNSGIRALAWPTR